MRALSAETSVNARPRNTLRTSHEGAFKCGVERVKAHGLGCRGFVANKWNHWAEHQVCERFQIQCTLRQIAEAGGFLMREARPWGSNAVFLFPTSVRIPTRILGLSDMGDMWFLHCSAIYMQLCGFDITLRSRGEGATP
jgi:hypothetical protein